VLLAALHGIATAAMRALEFAFRQIVELAAGIDLFGFVLA
jgi:hypothetical protein